MHAKLSLAKHETCTVTAGQFKNKYAVKTDCKRNVTLHANTIYSSKNAIQTHFLVHLQKAII